ncbi:MAG TPA: hypothetical protein VMU48_09865 [Terracidiphilus sp.]|nr:hypothetical protein [Candidatus Sulfotelmatobacter sp.]HUN84676.1 hypothetical protein [Terracidiphilus sp.]
MSEPLRYVSGEEIRGGDRVRFHGHLAEIEFAAADLSDPQHGSFVLEYGGGVMVKDPAVSGLTFIPVDQLRSYEDLELVARG